MKKYQTALVASLALSGATQAETYSNVVVFGDSLSDAGTYSQDIPQGGRFTTNPGPVWSENVSTALGFSAAPAQYLTGSEFALNAGGNIWAQGGARVNATPGYGSAPATSAQSVATQISTYLSTSGADSSALYAFWAGANDIFYQANPMTNPGASPEVIQANVMTAAQDLATQIAGLQAAGSRYILVYNLPDIGNTPFATAAGPDTASAFTGLSQLYNITLDAALNAAGVQALRLDIHNLFNEILANPAEYGFTVGSTGVACSTDSSLICTSADLTSPDAASTYVFADGVHPTTAGHQVISDYTLSVLRAPDAVARAADRMAATADSQWLGSDSRQRRFLDGLHPQDTGDLYVTGQIARATLGAENDQAELAGNPYSLRVGIDRNFGDVWFGGLAIAAVADNYDLSGSGSGRGRGVSFSGYGSKRFGPAYLNAAAMLTKMEYDIERDFSLGVAKRQEAGTASGNVAGLRLEAGYDFAQGALRHGPLVALSHHQVRLDGYSEMSGRSTAASYGDQKFDQLRASFGYQTSWQASESLRLSGRLTRENETKDSVRDLSYGLASNAGRMTVTVGNDSGNYTQLNLGMDWALSPASALSATLSATSSQHGSRQEAVLLTYSGRY